MHKIYPVHVHFLCKGVKDITLYNNAFSAESCRDAWNCLGNMTKEEAMVAYVDEMKLVCFHSCYRRNTRLSICSCSCILAKHSYHWHVPYLLSRSWRACPWQTRWRSSYASSARSTSWSTRRKRSHRFQTWAQVGFSWCSSTLHFVCVCGVRNSMWSLTML